MMEEAKVHASEDQERRKQIDARNALDSGIYQAEKTMNEHRAKIPVAVLSKVEQAIEAAKPLLEKQDASAADLEARSQALQAAVHEMGQALYQQEAAAGGGAQQQQQQGSNGNASNDGDVVDADFTEEK